MWRRIILNLYLLFYPRMFILKETIFYGVYAYNQSVFESEFVSY